MNQNPMSFINAALSHFEAKRREALATLELYIANPVGIGEHSNILDEIIKWTKVLSEAEECIESLKRNIQVGDETPSKEEQVKN
tara:strand:+ start:545 stop:796 length:252 start_codon:yes stop_codon:yes gene_type:complete